MTAHLLNITIGPVQDFIAAGRRSRDLWYGSHLLSELSRRVAREIASRGGKLIFPALGPGDAELQDCLTRAFACNSIPATRSSPTRPAA